MFVASYNDISHPSLVDLSEDINGLFVWDFFFKYFISIGIEAPFKGYFTINCHVIKAGIPITLHIKKRSYQKIIKYESIGH